MQKINPLYDSQKYYAQREKFEKTLLSKLSLSKRRKLYPILRTIIKVRNKLNGLKCIGNKSTSTDKPKIFSITHIGKLDFETVITYIKDHFILLTGDFEDLYGTVDGTFLFLNGCVFVRKDDAADRHLSNNTEETNSDTEQTSNNTEQTDSTNIITSVSDSVAYDNEGNKLLYCVNSDNNTVKITGFEGTIEKLYIPEKIESYTVTGIGDYAFFKTDITDVSFPKSITKIGEGAFYGCPKLKKLLLLKVMPY